MPGLQDVEYSLKGVFLLLRRRKDGFGWLDISADGFWQSFAAILYSVPALALTWASYRLAYLANADDKAAAGLSFIARLAAVDLATWIVPLIVLALAAKPLGISRHFVRFVIATNWLGVPISYATAVPALVMLVAPEAAPAGAALSLVVFAATIFALYRVTRLALDGDGGTAAIVTAAMVVLSLMTTGLLQKALDISLH
ncbi:MAG: hypothetical protein ACTHJ3_15795 [Pararhizobium sp.]